jgi:hypothetical protein
MFRARLAGLALVVLTACSGSAGAAARSLPSGSWGKVQATIDLGITGGTPVYGDGFLWVPDIDHGALWKLDPHTDRPVAHIAIGDRSALLARHCGPPTVHAYPIGSFSIRACDLPPAVAVVPGAVWVIRTDNLSVVRLDPATDHIAATVPIGIAGWDLLATPTDVWVTGYFDNEIVHIDARTGKVVAVLTDVPHGPTGLALGFGSLWVASSRTASLLKIDPAANRIVDVIGLQSGPLYLLSRPLPVTIAFGSVWTRLEYYNQLVRIDPSTDAIVARVPVSTFYGKDGLDHIGAGQGRLWVSGLSIQDVDPARNLVVRKIPISGITLEYAAGSLWAFNIGGPLYRIAPAS